MDLYIKLDRMREQRRVKVELNIRDREGCVGLASSIV